MDILAFARTHVPQLLATAALVIFAHTKKKLTPTGTLAATASALIHMSDPFPVFFWLLVSFFLLGVFVTKVGHTVKARLTQSSTGSAGGEGTRGWVQVFANSGFACILIIMHTFLLNSTPFMSSSLGIGPGIHAPKLLKVLPIGIMAQYAAVAADTFGSELGILAKSPPFLITAPWKRVPKGTNGGVTATGLWYGLLASAIIASISALFYAFSTPQRTLPLSVAALVCASGVLGSVIDSLLGATVQATVTDKGSGKVVEGPGGQRVMVTAGGSRVMMGKDLLTNNGVNLAMAASASLLAMGVAWELDLGM